MATLHAYQNQAVEWMQQRLSKQPGCALFADPGLGKTLMTLELIRREDYKKVLVVAPLRCVYSVWPEEIKKWKLFPGKVNIVHGPKKALGDARVDIINRDAMAWLEKQRFEHDYDLVVFDESTSFKNWTTKRMKSVRRQLKLPAFRDAKRVALTGTPVPNTYSDLFSQMYLLDKGKTYGTSLTKFRAQYCNRGGFRGHSYIFRKDRVDLMEANLRPLALRLDALDHLDLPPVVYNEIWCQMNSQESGIYEAVEKELFAKIEEEGDIMVGSASAAYIACKQMANGRCYRSSEDAHEKIRDVAEIHKHKLKALEELIDELNGKPLMIAYHFKHDLEAMRTIPALKKAPCVNGAVDAKTAKKAMDAWNARETRFLIVHPQSVSHGVNLQAGGNDLAWYGLTDRLEEYLQLNRRLWRQGVVGQVRIHHLLTKNTVEEAVLKRLTSKEDGQQALLNSLRSYYAKKR